MSVIGEKIDEARVLDPMAGSGALALEALSRGAKSALLADREVLAVRVIKANVDHLKANDLATVILARQMSQFDRLLPYGPFDLIFLDPPYEEVTLPLTFLLKLAATNLAAPHALAVWEQAPKTLATLEPDKLKPWTTLSTRTWGDRAAAFLTLS
jgi:16S rRNA (guanine966-N2)-methyltransferase